MQLRKTILASVLSAALALSAAACWHSGKHTKCEQRGGFRARSGNADAFPRSDRNGSAYRRADGKIHRISRTGKQRGKRKRRDYCGD